MWRGREEGVATGVREDQMLKANQAPGERQQPAPHPASHAPASAGTIWEHLELRILASKYLLLKLHPYFLVL